MRRNLVIFAAAALLFSEPAWAYLDPGSGNALIYLFISLASAFVYFFKSLYYRVLRLFKKDVKEAAKPVQPGNSGIALFSEGKSYWLTFKPVIEELRSRRIPFSYYTMDIEDPALTIDDEVMNSRFIGQGSVGFARLYGISADILLATTPNIGCADFPLKRPPKVKKMVHIWHSVCDTGFYHLGALDHYDAALTVGPWAEKTIRLVEEKRHLSKKDVSPVGLPYLDELATHITHSEKPAGDRRTILIAPSWGQKNCLKVYGTAFIRTLLENNFDVILRPHLQSFKSEPEFIESVREEYAHFKNFCFDTDTDGSKSMSRADLLVSDKSSIRFDFAFLYEKPVITLDIPAGDLSVYEASLIGRLWEEDIAPQIGVVITSGTELNILTAVAGAFSKKTSEIQNIKNSSVSNFGASSKAIVDWLAANSDRPKEK
jgi:hypothetical protein